MKRLFYSLIGVLLLAATLIMMGKTTVVSTPVAAAGGACEYYLIIDEMSTYGSPGFIAATETNGQCPSWYTVTQGYITGFGGTWACPIGTMVDMGGGVEGCVNTSNAANGTSAIVAEGVGFGPRQAISLHYKKLGSSGSWEYLDGRSRNIHGGDAPPGSGIGAENEEDCEADPEYHWVENECVPVNCPLIVPVGRQDVRLSSAANGVQFDIDADGTYERIAWPLSGSFLAIDLNEDGVINDGSELFGNTKEPNGFATLAALNKQFGGEDTAVLRAGNPLFDRMLLWHDANRDGISQASELQPASAAISGVGLGYQVSQRRDGHGNYFRYRGFVTKGAPATNARENADRSFPIYDVFLTTSQR